MSVGFEVSKRLKVWISPYKQCVTLKQTNAWVIGCLLCIEYRCKKKKNLTMNAEKQTIKPETACIAFWISLNYNQNLASNLQSFIHCWTLLFSWWEYGQFSGSYLVSPLSFTAGHRTTVSNCHAALNQQKSTFCASIVYATVTYLPVFVTVGYSYDKGAITFAPFSLVSIWFTFFFFLEP